MDSARRCAILAGRPADRGDRVRLRGSLRHNRVRVAMVAVWSFSGIGAYGMNPLVEVIRDAINERKQLEFRYHSLPRVVEPMCLGEIRRGVWQLRAHQVGGRSSSSRRLPDGIPRMFELADMVDVTALPDGFEVPNFYTRGDKAFIRIDAQL